MLTPNSRSGPISRIGALLRTQALGVIALVIALSGTAYAAGLAKNSVGALQIKADAVRSAEIKSGAVGGSEVRDGSLTGAELRDGTLTGADLRDGTITAADLSAGIPRARAYGVITCTADECQVERSKGIASVSTPNPGTVCVVMPGLDPTTDVPVLVAGLEGSTSPGNTYIEFFPGGSCGANSFYFSGSIRNKAIVRNAEGTGTTIVADDSFSDWHDVAFTVMVP